MLAAQGMKRLKACPVVLRKQGHDAEILAFSHPAAGFQLVKGSVEPGESPQAAALRELAEEAGIASATVVRFLGLWQPDDGPSWPFTLVAPATELAETWSHWCTDDGGHLFHFFWHPLFARQGRPWHRVFRDATHFIRQALGSSMLDAQYLGQPADPS